jgi:hypothetical protein
MPPLNLETEVHPHASPSCRVMLKFRFEKVIATSFEPMIGNAHIMHLG